ncbi:GNAT family N-acetyltransferase [soil metagenome]
MSSPVDVPVVEDVPVDDVSDLRYEVLRRGTPTDVVDLDGDRDPGTRHLAIRDGNGDVIATSTWLTRPCPAAPDRPAVQLRAMAVSDRVRRKGYGALMIAAGYEHARAVGADVVWANARDTALDFYQAQGLHVVGDGFVTTDTRLPHHVVLHDLRPEELPKRSAPATSSEV